MGFNEMPSNVVPEETFQARRLFRDAKESNGKTNIRYLGRALEDLKKQRKLNYTSNATVLEFPIDRIRQI